MFLKDIIARHLPKATKGRSRSSRAPRSRNTGGGGRRNRSASVSSSSTGSGTYTDSSDSYSEYYDSDGGSYASAYSSSGGSSSSGSSSLSASFSHGREGVESTIPGVPHVLIVSHKGAMVSMLHHMLGSHFKKVKNTSVFSLHVHAHNDIELVRDHDIDHLDRLMPAPPQPRGRDCCVQ